jgi:hypothetical protein
MSLESDDYDDVPDDDQSDGHTDGYGSGDDKPIMVPICRKLSIARVPLCLLKTIASLTTDHRPSHIPETPCGLPARVWMRAVAHRFADTSLDRVRSRYPSLLPAWLLQGFENYDVRAYDKNVISNPS